MSDPTPAGAAPRDEARSVDQLRGDLLSLAANARWDGFLNTLDLYVAAVAAAPRADPTEPPFAEYDSLAAKLAAARTPGRGE